MQSNARFYALLAVVLVALGGLWFLIRGGTPASGPAVTTTQTAKESKEPPQPAPEAPEVREAAKPKSGEPVGAAKTRPESTTTAALSGDGTIKGIAKDGSGNPVIGATVRILAISWKTYEARPDDAALQEAQTGADGKFSFTKLPVKTSYGVLAELGPLAAIDSTYIGEREKTAELELTLQPTSFIAGTVVNADGEPVVDAALYAVAWKEQSDNLPFNETEITRQVTDESGAFRFPHVPMGKFKMLVKSVAYAPLVSDWVLSGTEDAQFVLKEGGSIAGRVVNAQTREPASKVKVVARTEFDREEQRAESAADGTFAFANLRDASFNLSIVSETLSLAKLPETIKLAPTQEIGGIELEVGQGGTVSGYVRDAKTNKGVLKAHLYLQDANPGANRVNISKDVESDEDGAYTFSGLPTGNYSVYIGQAEGYVSEDYQKRQIVNVTPGQSVDEINFTLDSGTTIAGKVVDDTGAPVAQARVNAARKRGGRWASAESDLNGLFMITGVSADPDVFVRAEKKGLVSVPVGPLDLAAGPAEDVNITMLKEASISGVVVDEAGKPVPEAQVIAWKAGNDQQGFGLPSEQSDLAGAFTLGQLSEGDYQLEAPGNRGRGRGKRGEAIHLAAGESKTGVKVVTGGAGNLSISGRITGEDGKPVKNAQLSVYGPNSYADGETDSDGKFKVSGLKEGNYSINVQATGYTHGIVQSVAAGSENVDIVLKGTGKIEGKVLDAATGQPVTDFEVMYVANGGLDPRMFKQMGPGAHTHNDDGAFQIENAEAGVAALMVKGQGYAPKMQQVTDIVPGQTKSGVVVKLEAGASVEGRVVDSSGNPVAGAQIYDGPLPLADYERERSIRATSTADGSFTLDGLASGSVTISAYHAGYAGGNAQVQVQPGKAAHVDIVLGAGGTVRIRITENGAPATGAYAGIHRGSGSNAEQPDVNGVVELKEVVAGSYRAYAGLRDPAGDGRSNRNQQREITVTEGNVTEVAFDFAAGTAALAATVTVEGQPPSQAWATLVVTSGGTSGQEMRHVQVDSTGQFRIENLPPGQARLNVNGMIAESNPVTRVVTVDLTDGQTTEVTVDLGGGGTVSGTVSGLPQDGRVSVMLVQGSVSVPERATVEELSQLQGQLFTSGSYAGGAAVDAATGAFTLPNVQSGSYTLVATAFDADGSVRCASAPVTVSEGETATAALTLPR
jgi:protocatechuate 3,4-dioxygenase beta subunit